MSGENLLSRLDAKVYCGAPALSRAKAERARRQRAPFIRHVLVLLLLVEDLSLAGKCAKTPGKKSLEERQDVK